MSKMYLHLQYKKETGKDRPFALFPLDYDYDEIEYIEWLEDKLEKQLRNESEESSSKDHDVDR